MPTKIVSAAVAIGLLLAYVLPMTIKMRDLPLGIVLGVGVIAMVVDVWQSLQGD